MDVHEQVRLHVHVRVCVCVCVCVFLFFIFLGKTFLFLAFFLRIFQIISNNKRRIKNSIFLLTCYLKFINSVTCLHQREHKLNVTQTRLIFSKYSTPTTFCFLIFHFLYLDSEYKGINV